MAGIRIGDAERTAAADALGEHYAAGRIDQEEFEERLDAVWTARTAEDLSVLFEDLPAPYAGPVGWRTPPVPAPRATASRPARRGPHIPLPIMVVLIVALAITVASHLPVVLFVLAIVFLVTARRRARLSHAGACGRR